MSALSFVASALKLQQGMLIEYTLDSIPLILNFEFNPSSMTRTRSVTVKQNALHGLNGCYDFKTPSEAVRAAQGVSTGPESFSITILLDATDRMNAGNPIASTVGIQPEIDVIRSMLEPKSPLPAGAKLLSALGIGGGGGSEKSFPQYQAMSVLLFKWGLHLLPVFMTKAQIEHKAFLPWLVPYRAEATLELQVIESDNPFYNYETIRQSISVMANMVNSLGAAFSFSIGI